MSIFIKVESRVTDLCLKFTHGLLYYRRVECIVCILGWFILDDFKKIEVAEVNFEGDNIASSTQFLFFQAPIFQQSRSK